MGNRLIIYDTCNFRDYPVGGELTSIKNFLHYVADHYEHRLKDILLVGVSLEESEIGRITQIEIDGYTYPFLAVTEAPRELSKVKKSLRLQYFKGILKYGKRIGIKKADSNYIHTPEAFGAVSILRPGATCFVFSHGSYMNMWRNVRFFKKMPLIRIMFQQYLYGVIKKSRFVFALDKPCYDDYIKLNQNLMLVGNSIVTREREEKPPRDIPKLIFAGRLSDGKKVDGMIRAVRSYPEQLELTIVGDGEMWDYLHEVADSDERIIFTGAKKPDEVSELMSKSHILIMNSTYEGVPMAILEGLSHALPIVTTAVGGIGEVLEFGVDSERTDGTDESICQALGRILADYDTYADNAYKASLKFDYRKVNGRIFEILNKNLEWN